MRLVPRRATLSQIRLQPLPIQVWRRPPLDVQRPLLTLVWRRGVLLWGVFCAPPPPHILSPKSPPPKVPFPRREEPLDHRPNDVDARSGHRKQALDLRLELCRVTLTSTAAPRRSFEPFDGPVHARENVGKEHSN